MTEPAVPKDPRLSPVVRLAPAKLNLTLAVVGRRVDGLHDLHSVMTPLALADRLSLARAHGSSDTLHVTGRPIPVGEDGDGDGDGGNLVLRAVAAARAAIGPDVDAWPCAVLLNKAVPVAAGLGGGSSDAAAMLDAVFEAWGAELALGAASATGIRATLAARIGSDVPFFLAGGPALVTGRGESVDALPRLVGPAPGLLLVTPSVAAPTPRVFAAFDDDPAARPSDQGSVRAASEHLAVEWRGGLRSDALLTRAGVLASANDLAAAADVVVPGLRALRRALVRSLRRPVGLSGSGPTLWVLYASEAEARVASAVVAAGLADGSIIAPGAEPPSVIATNIPSEAPVMEDAGS